MASGNRGSQAGHSAFVHIGITSTCSRTWSVRSSVRACSWLRLMTSEAQLDHVRVDDVMAAHEHYLSGTSLLRFIEVALQHHHSERRHLPGIGQGHAYSPHGAGRLHHYHDRYLGTQGTIPPLYWAALCGQPRIRDQLHVDGLPLSKPLLTSSGQPQPQRGRWWSDRHPQGCCRVIGLQHKAPETRSSIVLAVRLGKSLMLRSNTLTSVTILRIRPTTSYGDEIAHSDRPSATRRSSR